MRLGAHLSIKGGFPAMGREAVRLGCEAVQVFSRSPRGGKPKQIAGSDADDLKATLREAGIRPLVIHSPYFLNLASDDPRNYDYSTQVLAEDVSRGAVLGASFVVVHPGHSSEDPECGLARIASAARVALEQAPGPRLLLENTAGQKREMGHSLEEVGRLLRMIDMPERTGACIDTCHAFAEGYDLRTEEGVDRLAGDAARFLGVGALLLMHLNDSMTGPGSHRDRHQHIGQGMIGLEGFRLILNHSSFQPLTGIIETPVDDPQSNSMNLNTLRGLRESP